VTDIPAKTKVLILDDEEDLCIVVKANLEDTGQFDVVTLSESREALKVILQEKPDIIILDNVMAHQRGDVLAKTLKKNEETRRIPLIMISGKGEMVFDKKKGSYSWYPNTPLVKYRGNISTARGAEELAQVYGVDAYFSKPFSTEILIQKINDLLTKSVKSAPEQEGPSPV